MRVKIKDIEPNPFRNMDRYPIQSEKIEALKASMESTGFWDNIVARPHPSKPDKFQIAYGHHRLQVLQETMDSDADIDLIVRPLDDATMLRMMADENGDEFRSSAAVTHETVRSIVEAYADGTIDLGPVPEGAAKDKLRYAPRFRPGDGREAAPDHPYTAGTVAAFLRWSEKKIQYALMALELIDHGQMTEDDFKGLSSEQARKVIVEQRKTVAEDQVPGVGAAVAKAIKEGKATTRTAGDVGAALRDGNPGETRRLADVVNRLIRECDGLFAPDTDQARMKRLDKVRKDRDQLAPALREKLVDVLVNLAGRIDDIATHLAGPEGTSPSSRQVSKMVQNKNPAAAAPAAPPLIEKINTIPPVAAHDAQGPTAEAGPSQASGGDALPEQAKPRPGGSSRPKRRNPRFPVGTVLKVIHKAKVHQFKVEADGFNYEGATYRTESALADKITGGTFSGTKFFARATVVGD